MPRCRSTPDRRRIEFTTDLSAHDRTWSRLERVTGAVGLVAIVLVFGSVITIGESEPPDLAAVEEAAAISATPTASGCSRRSPSSP